MNKMLITCHLHDAFTLAMGKHCRVEPTVGLCHAKTTYGITDILVDSFRLGYSTRIHSPLSRLRIRAKEVSVSQLFVAFDRQLHRVCGVHNLHI